MISSEHSNNLNGTLQENDRGYAPQPPNNIDTAEDKVPELGLGTFGYKEKMIKLL